jgi:hypothetical protein
MGDAPPDIVAIEPPVEGDGFPVITEESGHRFFKTTVAHSPFLAVFQCHGNKNGGVNAFDHAPGKKANL